MRILSRKTLSAFVQSHQHASDYQAVKAALDSWFAEASRATWTSSPEIKAMYGSASFVGDRVVFNIKGNDYRLVVAVDYARRTVFIKWLGSHEAYDKIDVRIVRYGD